LEQSNCDAAAHRVSTERRMPKGLKHPLPKVHKILLGSALFELFEIKTIWPSKARKYPLISTYSKVSLKFTILVSKLVFMEKSWFIVSFLNMILFFQPWQRWACTFIVP